MRYIIEIDEGFPDAYWIYEAKPIYKELPRRKCYRIIASHHRGDLNAVIPFDRTNRIIVTKHYKTFEDFVTDYLELFL